MDDDNGLLFMRTRFYSPEVGRFINKDPIRYLGGINLFTYVKNNPLNWIDPMGLLRIRWGYESPVQDRTADVIGCFEECMGFELAITGARAGPPYHDLMGAHPPGEACDFGRKNNPDLYKAETKKVEECFNKCGFVWGYRNGTVFHFQIVPGGGGAKGFHIWD
jgi:hypothetical protein